MSMMLCQQGGDKIKNFAFSFAKLEGIAKERGLTMSGIANGAGLKPQVLSAWKGGEYCPKYDKIKRICEFLGIPVSQLEEDSCD